MVPSRRLKWLRASFAVSDGAHGHCGGDDDIGTLIQQVLADAAETLTAIPAHADQGLDGFADFLSELENAHLHRHRGRRPTLATGRGVAGYD